jgi:hypothetical protein
MNHLPEHDDASSSSLESLLRAHAPPEVADDGFTARTLQAVRRATVDAARPPALAPAEALTLEFRRHAAQARAWRWTIAGVAAGALLMFAMVIASPEGAAPPFVVAVAEAQSPPPWLPLWALAFLGAVWLAIKEFRSDP